MQRLDLFFNAVPHTKKVLNFTPSISPLRMLTPLLFSQPRVIADLFDSQALRDVSIQHGSDQIDASGAHDPWNPKFVIQDLVDAVEWILFVDDGV